MEDNGKILIAGMKPTMMSQLFPSVSYDEAMLVEKDVKEIIDNSR